MGRSRRQISEARKSLHRFGVVLQIGGFVGFLACFAAFATAGSFDSAMPWWVAGLVSMFAMIGGGAMRHVAARGVAGSGLVLDPDAARDDLEPWARVAGGLAKDAIDESGVLQGRADEPAIRVRCRACRTLNDEDAKFCDECGKPL